MRAYTHQPFHVRRHGSAVELDKMATFMDGRATQKATPQPRRGSTFPPARLSDVSQPRGRVLPTPTDREDTEGAEDGAAVGSGSSGEAARDVEDTEGCVLP